MAMDVHEQLDRLAQQAPNGGPPPDLWRRGVRRTRARRAVLAAAASLVTAVGAFAATLTPLTNSDDAVSDSPRQVAGLPDHVYVPSEWAKGTTGAGAPGPLAFVASTERRTSWFSTGRRYYGVSAVDGTTRFLDLPGIDLDQGFVALAPDGRRVAYVLRGPVPGRRQSQDVGIAVYDTVTGKVTRWTTPSRYGLAFNGGVGFSADSTQVLASYGFNLREEGVSNDYRLVAIDPRTGSQERLGRDADGPWWGYAPAGYAWSDDRTVWWSRPGRPVASARIDNRLQGPPVLSPDGTSALFSGTTTKADGGQYPALHVVRLGRGPLHARMLAPRLRSDRVLGWVDDRRAWVSFASPVGGSPTIRLLDTVTGGLSGRIPVQGATGALEPQAATALAANPLVHVTAPRRPWDPRVVAAIGGLSGLSLVVAALTWASRRRLRRVAG